MSARTVDFVRLVKSRTVLNTLPRVAEGVKRTHVAGAGRVVPGVPRWTPRKALRSEQVHRCPPARKEARCARRGKPVAVAARASAVRTGARGQHLELARGTGVEAVGGAVGEEETGHANRALKIGRPRAAETLQRAGQTVEGGEHFVVVFDWAVARVIGVVRGVVRGAGVDAHVVKEERFVAAESVAARADGGTRALEAGRSAGEAPVLVDAGGRFIEEVDAGRVGVGGLWTDSVAELVARVEVVAAGVVADLADRLRRAGQASRPAVTRE